MHDARTMVDYATRWVAGILWPVRCIGCGRFGERTTEYLCNRCAEGIPTRSEPHCIGCEAPAASGRTCAPCRRTWSVDRFLAACDIAHPLVHASVHVYKYEFVRRLAEPMSRIMLRFLDDQRQLAERSLPAHPLVVPVPLHPARRRWRGFNQAEQLCRAVGDALLWDVRLDVLIRARAGKPQAEVERRTERLERLTNTFRCASTDILRGRNILLIDDVATTGATLDACATVLKTAGARSVTALVFAHGD